MDHGERQEPKRLGSIKLGAVSPIQMGPLMVKFYHKPMGKFYHKSYGKILTPPGGRFFWEKREKVGRKYKDIFLRIISEDFYH